MPAARAASGPGVPQVKLSTTDEPTAPILVGCDLESYESSRLAAREAELLPCKQRSPGPLPDHAWLALSPRILYSRARKANPWLFLLLPL